MLNFDAPETSFQADYPPDFLAAYEPLECLAPKPESETLFVRDRVSGAFAVAKCYRDKALLSRDTEGSILQSLHHEGLPRFLGSYENEAMLCIVREYIRGVPLCELADQAPFTQEETLQVTMQLCDILTYLHSREPPVIHRDIKPQNIVISDEGTARLIDFGIARTFDASASKDTTFYGTQEFAPPEQYGFAQTDCRSDLFSLGVVMGYLLTGQTDLKEAAQAIKNKRLSRIYRTCTDFNPRNRYASSGKLKAALQKADGKHQRAMVRTVGLALACLVFLFGGFFIGRHTDVLTPKTKPIVFKEPLIEQAVRLQLNKNDSAVLTGADLLKVTELYIFGDSVVVATEDEMNRAADALLAENAMRHGPVLVLDDLVKLPNLEKVAMAMQQVSDLTPLASLPSLKVLIIKNNPVEDIRPLSGLMQLERLSAFGTHVGDFTSLAACPQLRNLEAGGTPVRTPAAFAGMNSLTHLILCKHTLTSLEGISLFTNLKNLDLGNVLDADLSSLLELPKLETLTIDPILQKAAERIAGQAQFIINIQK